MTSPRHAAISIAAMVAMATVAALTAAAADTGQADPPGWTRIDTGPFSVALPPGWRYESTVGIDSFVGLFVGDGIELLFDLGPWWNSPPDDDSGHVVRREVVDFRCAAIYVPRDPQGVVGLFIEHVDDIGSLAGVQHLSIVGRGVPAGRQADVVGIFRSVRFRRSIRDGGRWEQVPPPPGDVALRDIDLFMGWEPRVAGARIGADGAAQARMFHYAEAGWQEHVLEGARAGLGIDGVWAVTDEALFRWAFDGEIGVWQRERTVADDFSLADVADDGMYGFDGWAIGTGVIRLGVDRSTASDGGWGTASGRAIDVLPRDPLGPGGRGAAPAPDALAVGPDGAHRFDGRRWQVADWDPSGFAPFDVDLVGADAGWIVGVDDRGRGGGLRHWQGGVVAAAPMTTTNPLLAVDLLSGAEGWAVGGGLAGGVPAGELWRLREGVWERQPSPCACVLWAVQAQHDGQTWAVGHTIGDGPRQGVVLRYVPAGPTGTPVAGATAPQGPATGTAGAMPSATPQAGDRRLWLPLAYQPLPAR